MNILCGGSVNGNEVLQLYEAIYATGVVSQGTALFFSGHRRNFCHYSRFRIDIICENGYNSKCDILLLKEKFTKNQQKLNALIWDIILVVLCPIAFTTSLLRVCWF